MALRTRTKHELLGTENWNMRKSQKVEGLRSKLSGKSGVQGVVDWGAGVFRQVEEFRWIPGGPTNSRSLPHKGLGFRVPECSIFRTRVKIVCDAPRERGSAREPCIHMVCLEYTLASESQGSHLAFTGAHLFFPPSAAWVCACRRRAFCSRWCGPSHTHNMQGTVENVTPV